MALNIILTTDFSEKATNAIRWTTNFLSDIDCTFYLLHAYSIAPSSGESKFSTTIKLETFKQQLMEKASAKHRFETIIEVELLRPLIQDILKTHAIDFIVVGTKRISQFWNTFFGSNAVDVVNQIADCPVIAIPENSLELGKTKLILAYDFNIEIPSDKLDTFEKLMTHKALSVSLVTVLEHNNKETANQLNLQNHFRTSFPNMDVEFISLEKHGSITKTLFNYVQQQDDVAMVAYIRREHDYFYHFTHEAVIKKETLSADFPLLLL